MTFRRAIVRPPAATFAEGLTTAGLGLPDLPLALAQHAAYVAALEACGVAVTALPPHEGYPDSTFVEDTAVLARGLAVLCRPGAASRAGEVEAIRSAVEAFFSSPAAIEAPGTVDGGDALRGRGPRLHRRLGEDERGGSEAARGAPLGPRARLDARRRAGRSRTPPPQERDRLARRTDPRSDRGPRAPPRVRRLDAAPGLSRRGVRRKRRPRERARPSRRRLPPFRGGRSRTRPSRRPSRHVGVPKARRRPQLSLPPLLTRRAAAPFPRSRRTRRGRD